MGRVPETLREQDPRTFWVTVLAAGAAAWLAIRMTLPHVVPPALNDEQLKQVFLASAVELCAPEPAEFVGYVLAVLVPAAFVSVTALLLRRQGALAADRSSAAPWTLLAFLSQGAFAVVAAYGILYEHFHGAYYPSLRFPVVLIAAAAAAGYGLWTVGLPAHWKSDLTAAGRVLGQRAWLWWGLATSWSVLWVLPNVFTEADRSAWLTQTAYHIPFTMGEFAAVLNGRTPMVDFYSQYQNVLPLLLSPLLRWTGLSLFSFTLTMALLSVTGLLLLFSVLTRVVRSSWLALVLFLPMVAFSFEPVETNVGGYVHNMFTYYAMGPLRFLGVFVLARLSLWYLERPSYSRLAQSAAIAGIVALNNLDFGLPALAAVLSCVVLFAPRFGRSTPAVRICMAVLTFLLTAGMAVVVYFVAVRLRAGAWPMVANLVLYQKTFAASGFAMVEAPQAGFYQTIFLILLLPVLVALFEVFSGSFLESGRRARIEYGTLIYAGIAGLGVFTYYAGRSDPGALPVAFCPAAYALVLLVYRFGAGVIPSRLSGGSTAPGLRIIPGVVVLTLFSLTFPGVFNAPHPGAQLARLRRGLAKLPDPHQNAVEVIRRYVPPGKQTVIIAPDAHWLAMKAGVINRYPFSHSGSLLIRDQLGPVMNAIAALPNKKVVFGEVQPELAQRLMAKGFTNIEPNAALSVWGQR